MLRTSAASPLRRAPRSARHAGPETRRPAGERCGSSPDADVVTSSTGTGVPDWSPRAGARSVSTLAIERRACRTEVRTAGRGRIVALTRCRRTRPEISRPRERLADQAAIRPHVPCRSTSEPLACDREQHLRGGGDEQRISEAEDHRRDDGETASRRVNMANTVRCRSSLVTYAFSASLECEFARSHSQSQ